MSSDPARAKHSLRVGLRAVLCVGIVLTSAAVVPSRAQANDGLATSVASTNVAPRDADEGAIHTAAWPFFKPRHRPIYESSPGNVTPHPAVARIIVPERGATAFGSGTLVDVRDQYGLVVTNSHVVRDARGVVEVVFPNGFRSHARPLKVDSDWDLAALVIWRPPIEPVTIASQPPRPGDLLTIHGYGQGQYRIATGRCTAYYAPRMSLPQEMVELDVEARQGDSGGPIFNHRGELAGVLFGAGQGTTLGSFSPRVTNFLATLAPDIGQAKDQALVAVADRPAPNVRQASHNGADSKPSYPNSPWSPADTVAAKDLTNEPVITAPAVQLANASAASRQTIGEPLAWNDVAYSGWYDRVKSGLALVGLAVIAIRLVKIVR